MSSKGQQLSASISTNFDAEFPLTLEPKIEKLTFGSNYAIQGIPLSETIGFYNNTDSTYKLTVTTGESPKYELTVDESKFTIKKGERIQIKITLVFRHYATMGLTGQVQFSLKKKSLMGGESIQRALRFQLEGVVPAYNEKDLVKSSDDEQFRVGMINGVLSMVKNESVVAFKYNVKDEFEKQDYEFIQSVYRDIHHPAILGMAGIVLSSSTILLDGDTVTDLQSLMEKEKWLFHSY
ncbi:ephrin typeA receptor 4A, putative [Entamoeba histolytica KU27]|uniref:Ephrin typeA receptor 4A, putative n=1 Tax=Entamoeba histolytica KU27 TaxID=885311 RepID=M2R744_ENTHI|nr:ephrin typeA receptor 4A, putative [Entamoeba histolytica KU27]